MSTFGRWLIVVAVASLAGAGIGIDLRATYGARVSADEPQYLLTAISLAEDFDLDISDEISDRRFEPFHEIGLNPQTIALRDDGQEISPHDPLLPAVLALPIAVGGWVGARLAMVTLAVLTAMATFVFAVRRLNVQPHAAGVVTALAFGSAPLAVYGSQIYPAMPAALAVILGVHAVTGPPSRWSTTVVVLSVLALPWLAIKYVPLAAVLALALLWRERQHRQTLGWVLAILAAGGVSYLVIHQRIWGGWTPYASGDHFVGGEFEVVGTNPNYVARTNRLMGLIVDRFFGIGAWAPMYLLTVPAVVVMVNRAGKARDRVVALAPLMLLGVGWAVATWVALTMHGWWWSGRQIVPVVPLIVVGIAALVDRFERLWWPVIVVGFWGVFNWAWMAWETSTGRRALIVDHESTSNPLFQAWKFVLPDHRVDGPADQVLTLVWIGVFATAGWWTFRSLTSRWQR